MKKLFLTILFALLPTLVGAQITVTYTFSPNTTILSSQVNANFALFANALNRTGGTMTGALVAQTITASTANAYDIGATGNEFRNGYFLGALSAASATFTGTVAANLFSGSGASLTGVSLYPNAIAKKTTNYTALTSDNFLTCDATAGNVTITVFTPVGNAGKRLDVKKIDSSANTCILSAAAGNIDGAGTYTIQIQYQAITLVSDGTNWNIF